MSTLFLELETSWLLFFSIGCAVGLVSSYLGAGGGILIMPLLPLIVDWTYREILATCQLTVFFVVTRNLVAFQKKKTIPWSIVFVTGPAAAASSFLASLGTGWVSEEILIVSFIFVMLLLSLKTWWLNPMKPVVTEKKERQKKAFVLILGALGGGTLAGLTGVGAGMVMIPLIMASGLVMGAQIAPASNGTLAFTTFWALLPLLFDPVSGFEGWSLLRWGLVHVEASLLIFLGAYLTSSIGHRYQANFSPIWRKRLVASLLSLLTLQLIVREWPLLLDVFEKAKLGAT